MSRLYAKARNPVHPLPAGQAVEDEPPEFPFKVGLHVQKLESEHLGMERDGVGAAEVCVNRFVHKPVGGRDLLAHGTYRSLKDAALAPHQRDARPLRGEQTSGRSGGRFRQPSAPPGAAYGIKRTANLAACPIRSSPRAF